LLLINLSESFHRLAIIFASIFAALGLTTVLTTDEKEVDHWNYWSQSIPSQFGSF
jgi:hypothetical protein